MSILHYTSLTFVDGTTVTLPENGVIVVVGPNNSGKSTMLGEIRANVSGQDFSVNNKPNQVIADGLLKAANHGEITTWYEGFPLAAVEPTGPQYLRRRNWSSVVDPINALDWQGIAAPRGSRGSLSPLLLSPGPVGTFHGLAPDVYGAFGSVGQDSAQFDEMYRDAKIEQRISDLSRKVFGTPVSLSRVGRTAVLHWGQIPPTTHPVTEAEAAILRTFPKVSDQSTGVTHLLSLAISMELGREPFVILDEPDAFLHPPQARHAGRFVAERGRRSQVFLATHSLNFLLGILDADVNVTIIRLDRPDTCPTVAVVDAATLKASWRDPAVRYSGVLAGLFHRAVVLCEGEADCRYFEIALDWLRRDDSAHDQLFVSAGGKAGMKKLIPILTALRVPVKVVGDFDILKDWSTLSTLLELLGSEPDEAKSLWTGLNGHLSQVSDSRSVAEVRSALADTLEGLDGPYNNKSLAAALAGIVRLGGLPADIKRSGVDALRGGPRVQADLLLAALAPCGLHVVPFGELEAFHPDISGHGPQWLAEVIERRAYENLEGTRGEFVRRLVMVRDRE